MMKAWHLNRCRALGLRLKQTSHPAPAVEQTAAITMMKRTVVERTIEPGNANIRNHWMNRTSRC